MLNLTTVIRVPLTSVAEFRNAVMLLGATGRDFTLESYRRNQGFS